MMRTDYPFGVAITRVHDGVVIFNTTTNGKFNGLVFENQYLEWSTQLPANPNVYGLGEHIRKLRIDPDGSKHVRCVGVSMIYVISWRGQVS
jgi:hypothetical protein